MQATDADQSGSPNSYIDYKIKSVTPNPPDIEFAIDQQGKISFKGCLDYEVNYAMYGVCFSMNMSIRLQCRLITRV